MATSYSTSLRLALPVTGELNGTWGDVVNAQITNMVDEAVAGYASIAITGDTTLTTANGSTDQSRKMMLKFTGTLSAGANIIVPTVSKLYFIKNATTGGFAITVKPTAGTGVAVAAGGSAIVFCDGTNVVDALSSASLTGAFNGTVGAITPSTGAFTTLSSSGNITGTGTTPAFISDTSDGADNKYVSIGGGGAVSEGRGAYISLGGNENTFNGTGGDVQISGGNAAGAKVKVRTAGTNVAEFSSAGLSVTGTLSATGTATLGTTGSRGQIVFNSSSDGVGIGSVTAVGTNELSIDGAGGTLTLSTSGSTKATLDSSGNLGLGVTPSASNSKAVEVGNPGSIFTSRADNTTEIYQGIYYNSGYKYAQSAYSVSAFQMQAGAFYWLSGGNGTKDTTVSSLPVAMTLDASGGFSLGGGVGNDNSNSFWSASYNGYFGQNHISGMASSTRYAYFAYGGTEIGSITQNGTTAVAFNTTSDHRLKENVRPANAARFMDIEFVDFEWVDGRHDCGVIAHQLQSVYPDLVIGEKDATEVREVEITPAIPEVKDEEGNIVTEAIPAVTEAQTFPKYQQVNYIGLIGRMGTTIQKQQRMLEAMEARLAALEAA